MKDMIITAYDDIEYARDRKARVPAVETVTLSLRDRTVELDLGEANLKLLEETLEPWFAAGGKPGNTRMYDAGKREYNAAMRKWADDNGYEYKYQSAQTSGKAYYYYPGALQKAFAEHLRTRNG